jgi:glutamate racemase
LLALVSGVFDLPWPPVCNLLPNLCTHYSFIQGKIHLYFHLRIKINRSIQNVLFPNVDSTVYLTTGGGLCTHYPFIQEKMWCLTNDLFEDDKQFI